MSRRKKHLNSDDKKIWKKVTETVEPLEADGKLPPPITKSDQALDGVWEKPERMMPAGQKVQNPTTPSSEVTIKAQPHNIFDPKTVKKISTGKMAIDARIDLHGQTQEQAITALRRFIHLAYASDYRLVLVITGKGSLGQGILRQRVPDWLSTGELGSMVSGVRAAGVAHGGEGALYVRLRRAGRRN